MRILITGGNGFLSNFLIRELLALGIDTVSFDVVPVPRLMADLLDRVEFARGSVLRPTDLIRACQRFGVDRIVHLPSIMSAESRRDPFLAYELNVGGTINVLEVASILGLERVVCASSVAVYSSEAPPMQREKDPAQPSTIYGMTKLGVEQLGAVYAQDRGLHVLALRPTRLYGPGRARGELEETIICSLHDGALHWPGGPAMELLYVRDQARAFAAATVADLPGYRVINTCSDRKYSVKEVMAALRIALPTFPVQPEDPPTSAQSEDELLPRMDSQRAVQELGWRPQFSLEEGIGQLVIWLQEEQRLQPATA
jgi:UDP-glucose 4-epimerase